MYTSMNWATISSGSGLPHLFGVKLSTEWMLIYKLETWRQPNALQWRHNGQDSVSNHQPHDCLFNRLFRRRSRKTSKLRVTGLCAGNSPWTSEFPAQRASYAENVSIWWRHHGEYIWKCHLLTDGRYLTIMHHMLSYMRKYLSKQMFTQFINTYAPFGHTELSKSFNDLHVRNQLIVTKATFIVTVENILLT